MQSFTFEGQGLTHTESERPRSGNVYGHQSAGNGAQQIMVHPTLSGKLHSVHVWMFLTLH